MEAKSAAADSVRRRRGRSGGHQGDDAVRASLVQAVAMVGVCVEEEAFFGLDSAGSVTARRYDERPELLSLRSRLYDYKEK